MRMCFFSIYFDSKSREMRCGWKTAETMGTSHQYQRFSRIYLIIINLVIIITLLYHNCINNLKIIVYCRVELII